MAMRVTGWLTAQPYAHRGLHGGAVAENSRQAFRQAIAHGYGIELDTQISRDGMAFVFHDAVLDRLTEATGPFADLNAASLSSIRLAGTDETIPLLSDILADIGGRVPLLIEIKVPRHTRHAVGMHCLAVRRALEGYLGPVAIMSFDPEVGAWFERNAPKFLRGLVLTEQQEHGWWRRMRGKFFRRYAFKRVKPDFIACDVRDLPTRTSRRMRKRHMPVLTWTVRDAASERHAFKHADEVIFEFGPKSAPAGAITAGRGGHAANGPAIAARRENWQIA